jgi:hypothetical protein
LTGKKDQLEDHSQNGKKGKILMRHPINLARIPGACFEASIPGLPCDQKAKALMISPIVVSAAAA